MQTLKNIPACEHFVMKEQFNNFQITFIMFDEKIQKQAWAELGQAQ